MNLDDYRPESRDRLSLAEMGNGIAVANRNARRLVTDSLVLLEHHRFPSALALSVLAMEESVKWWALAQVAILGEKHEVVAAWKDNIDHRVKLGRAFRTMAAAIEAGRPSDYTAEMEMLASSTQLMKLRAMYSAFVEGRRWVEPSDVVEAAEARLVVGVAATLAVGPFRMTGRRLGELLERLPYFLEAEAEEVTRQGLVVWARGAEASALAESDDAESDLLRTTSRQRLADWAAK